MCTLFLDVFFIFYQGTETIEGIILDGNMLKDHEKIRITSNENYGGKRKLEEFLNNSQIGRPERSWMSIFSSHTMDTVGVPNEDLVTDAFIKMRKLKFLLLSNIQLCGCYKKFPKNLRWLSWHCLQLESLPSDIPLESLVALDLQYSSLKQLWKGPKVLYYPITFSSIVFKVINWPSNMSFHFFVPFIVNQMSKVSQSQPLLSA